MKDFDDVAFDPATCRQDLAALKKLLRRKELSERDDIQSFFKKRVQLASYIGGFLPHIGPASRIAFEFPLLGDFAADIVIGSRALGEYCLIELEDARTNSIFRKTKRRLTRDWSPRFSHGFNQIVDWFFCLDDFKKTERFARDFGPGHIKFHGLLIIGRDAGVSEYERLRLRWRTEKIVVDSHSISCITFDDLHQNLQSRLDLFYPETTPFERNAGG